MNYDITYDIKRSILKFIWHEKNEENIGKNMHFYLKEKEKGNPK